MPGHEGFEKQDMMPVANDMMEEPKDSKIDGATDAVKTMIKGLKIDN